MDIKRFVLVLYICSAYVILGMNVEGSDFPKGPQGPEPYRYNSLKGLSNQELIAFMGRGPSVAAGEWVERHKVIVPEDFWDSSPRDAALALLAATQTPAEKKIYAVAIEEPAASPPSAGTFVFSAYSDRSYNDVRSHYFVGFSPEGSFFAYAMMLSPGQVGYDITQAETAYDLRSCELTYAEARHFAQVIWWLNQARTTKKADKPVSSLMFFKPLSTADGRGHLALARDGGGESIEEAGALRAVASGIWRDEYDKEAFLNVAWFAVEEILYARVSKRWPGADANRVNRYLTISRGSAGYTPEELSRVREGILRFLGLFTADGRRISPWHVLVAARAAGDIVFAEAAPLLKAVQKNLPTPDRDKKKTVRTPAEVLAEINKLTAEAANEDSEEKADELEEKIDGLFEELERLQGQAVSREAIENELRTAVSTAIRKIELGEDIAALTTWARLRDADSIWAASRLRRVSAAAYADVLADWLGLARPEHKAQILHAISRAAPQRALDIASRVRPSGGSELNAAASEILDKAGLLSGDQDRIAALIKIARDNRAGWEERTSAVALLVPRDDPMRFPGKDIDDALISIIESEPSGDFMPDFTLPAAARALAWRKRLDKLDRLIALFETRAGSRMPLHTEDFLSAVTYLARKDKEAGSRRLAQVIVPHLKRTNLRITEVLWSVWAADLREFKRDIERIATASPTEEEGRKASTSGGMPTEVNERYHLARKIAAIWNEEDLQTRGKLLLSFGLSESYEFTEAEALERRERMREALATLGSEAAGADLKALGGFLAWAEDEVVRKESEPVYRERMEAFVRLAREILGL